MKYYSESLKKIFDTQEELQEAENKAASKEQEQEHRRHEVEEAKDIAEEAWKRYLDLSEKYCKDYGSHACTRPAENSAKWHFSSPLLDLFDWLD